LFYEKLLGVGGDFGVHARQDAREIFEDSDLRTEASPDGAEFEADEAGADHDETFWDFAEAEGFGGSDDAIAIELNAFERGDLAAGGDDDVFGF
jgi:hypothetical protein